MGLRDITPKFISGGELPKADYTLELIKVGNFKDGQFRDGLVARSSNGNPNVILNWRITKGNSHIGLYVSDRITFTEDTLPYFVGKLSIFEGGEDNIPDLDTDSMLTLARAFVAHMEENHIGGKLQLVAYCGPDDDTRKPIVYRYHRKA